MSCQSVKSSNANSTNLCPDTLIDHILRNLVGHEYNRETSVALQNFRLVNKLFNNVGKNYESIYIKRIAICSRQITNDQLSHIAGRFPRLRDLDLSANEQITNEGLIHVSKLSGLRDLDLSDDDQITNEGLIHVSKLNGLRKLNLSWCQITNDILPDLFEGCPHLSYLNLNRCRKITNEGLEHLGRFTNLTYLNLSDCDITMLAPLVNLTSLRFLDLNSCDEVRDDELAHIGKFTNLRELHLLNCPHITNNRLAHFAERLTSLRTLFLGGCDHITNEGLACLGSLTNLSTLHLNNCRQISNFAIEDLQRSLPDLKIYLGIFGGLFHL